MSDEPRWTDRRLLVEQLRDAERERYAREKAAEWAADHPAKQRGGSNP